MVLASTASATSEPVAMMRHEVVDRGKLRCEDEELVWVRDEDPRVPDGRLPSHQPVGAEMEVLHLPKGLLLEEDDLVAQIERDGTADFPEFPPA